jgi:hypothetical protein
MTAFGAEEKALGDSVELVSNRSASFRQGSEGQLWVDAVEKGLRNGLNDDSCSLNESGKIRR